MRSAQVKLVVAQRSHRLVKVEAQFVTRQFGGHQLVVFQRRLVHLREDVVVDDLLEPVRIGDPRLLNGVGDSTEGFVGRSQQRHVDQ